MAGISADRFWQDGTREEIATPAEFRLMSSDPEEETRLEQKYVEHNRRTYSDLRERGLLLPSGQNLGSQDINEYLRTQESAE